MSYTNCLPAWSVGTDCYKDIYNVVRRYGKSAVLIGGKTALEKAGHLIEAALADVDFQIVGSLWYGGDSNYENVDTLVEMDVVKSADMVFGVGGGRAIDLCKAVAQGLDKPLITFPTIASNCAAVTSIGVFYDANGGFKEYYYPERCPEHCFINTQVIAEAPVEFLWAGIGDGLSKECEVELATRGKKLDHITYLGSKLALACTDPLIEFGAKSLEECKNKEAGYAMDQVALAIVVSTGVVSNCTAHPTAYYYNSSLAHCVYYGSTLVPSSGHKHLHGEIVSYGVLTLLTYDKNFKERDRIMEFNHSLGLPVTLEQIGLLTAEDLEVVTDRAMATVEWEKAPYPVTKEGFIQAMLDADKAGKEFLAKQG